jgi:hypothetical protein
MSFLTAQLSSYGIGIAAAIGLFACRSFIPRIYGLIEVFVGLFMLYLSSQTGGSFSKDFSSDFATVSPNAQAIHVLGAIFVVQVTTFLGAVFVMVRGLDNMLFGESRRKKL